MNINTKHNKKKTQIPQRKQHHLDVCKSGSGTTIESKTACGFESLQFIHTALPELSYDEISLKTSFLGRTISAPLFISCMTGGTEEGLIANQELVKAAQKMNIPFGLGSMRVLFSHPERIKDFSMRPFAPDIPIVGNIGAVQLKECSSHTCKELIQRLELDALAIHLNCGQELFQIGGDRDFRGLKQAIENAINSLRIPIIVKETGFGIRPKLVQELISLGVEYVDLAGAGGTNWILVEDSANGESHEFATWGLSTALLLESVRHFPGKVLASGGIRSGMDLAKALALGAHAGGSALPFIQSAIDGGQEAVCQKIEQMQKTLTTVMILTGSKTIESLKQAPLLKSLEFLSLSSTLNAIEFPS